MKKSCSQILTENNFFEAENFFAYQKKKIHLKHCFHSYSKFWIQYLENMVIAVMANLQRAFDTTNRFSTNLRDTLRLLSPLIFLVYTAEVPYNWHNSRVSSSESWESKYADNVEFWRVQTNIFQAISSIIIQIAIINLQTSMEQWPSG